MGLVKSRLKHQLCHQRRTDVRMKHMPTSTGSKGQQDGAAARENEQHRLSVNAPHSVSSACQGESGLFRRVTPGVSHPVDAVISVSKINIWALADSSAGSNLIHQRPDLQSVY